MGMRLLLVEDETRMAQALSEILRQEKYDVDWFADGQEGLCALETATYDLAVLDVMLPGKNGFEIAAAARSRGVRTPILMLTAKSELDDKITGLDSGADDYLTKPFMTRELLARLRALGRRTMQSADGKLRFGDLVLHKESSRLLPAQLRRKQRAPERKGTAPPRISYRQSGTYPDAGTACHEDLGI